MTHVVYIVKPVHLIILRMVHVRIIIVDPFQLNSFAQFPIVCAMKCDVGMINLHKYTGKEGGKKGILKTGVMPI